jgi:hypothetical protein
MVLPMASALSREGWVAGLRSVFIASWREASLESHVDACAFPIRTIGGLCAVPGLSTRRDAAEIRDH